MQISTQDTKSIESIKKIAVIRNQLDMKEANQNNPYLVKQKSDPNSSNQNT